MVQDQIAGGNCIKNNPFAFPEDLNRFAFVIFFELFHHLKSFSLLSNLEEAEDDETSRKVH